MSDIQHLFNTLELLTELCVNFTLRHHLWRWSWRLMLTFIGIPWKDDAGLSCIKEIHMLLEHRAVIRAAWCALGLFHSGCPISSRLPRVAERFL